MANTDLINKLQRNVDRVAVVVFFMLVGLVFYIWYGERTTDPGTSAQVNPSQMEPHIPNPEYAKVMEAFSWDGKLYEKRPIGDDHPMVDIVRYNLFAQREPPTEQEVIEQVNQAMQVATAALEQAKGLTNDDPRKEVLLERAIDQCDRVITVWAAVSDGAQQGVARQTREEATALLNELLGVTGETTGP